MKIEKMAPRELAAHLTSRLDLWAHDLRAAEVPDNSPDRALGTAVLLTCEA